MSQMYLRTWLYNRFLPIFADWERYPLTRIAQMLKVVETFRGYVAVMKDNNIYQALTIHAPYTI